MSVTLLVLVVIGFASLFGTMKETSKVHGTVKAVAKTRVPHMLGMVILGVQTGELIRTAQHITVLHIIAGFFLFVVWAAVRTGVDHDIF